MDSLSKHIAAIREDYIMNTLDEKDAGADPVSFFKKWFQEAEHAAVTEVNAMTLATISAEGFPHARIVLLKGIEDEQFVFYTNYHSRKGQDLAQNARVAVVFFWKELQRQVRVEGTVQQVAASVSDEYFASRPYTSQIGALVSPQSTIIANRDVLEDRLAALLKEYPEGSIVPRPQHWGGYAIQPTKIEFWQGRASRLHDRIVFERNDAAQWTKYRLAP